MMRRISIFGGPGIGKSTIAPKVFAELKILGFSVGLIHEYIKKWAYLKRQPTSYDQVYIFGHQLHQEDYHMQAGVDLIITDSPLLLQCFYANFYKHPSANPLLEIAKSYEKDYPSLNILLERGDIPYKTEGRYETYEEALERDRALKTFLEQHCQTTIFQARDFEGILKYILEQNEPQS